MIDGVPEYAECENCGQIVPDGGHTHTAYKREYNTTFGNFTNCERHLCCICIKAVGGQCDE